MNKYPISTYPAPFQLALSLISNIQISRTLPSGLLLIPYNMYPVAYVLALLLIPYYDISLALPLITDISVSSTSTLCTLFRILYTSILLTPKMVLLGSPYTSHQPPAIIVQK